MTGVRGQAGEEGHGVAGVAAAAAAAPAQPLPELPADAPSDSLTAGVPGQAGGEEQVLLVSTDPGAAAGVSGVPAGEMAEEPPAGEVGAEPPLGS
jgi:hypothetical protein